MHSACGLARDHERQIASLVAVLEHERARVGAFPLEAAASGLMAVADRLRLAAQPRCAVVTNPSPRRRRLGEQPRDDRHGARRRGLRSHIQASAVTRDVNVIAYSAKPDVGDAPFARWFVDVLQKPAAPDAIVVAVERSVEGSRIKKAVPTSVL